MTEAIEVANASPSTNHINDLRPFKGWAIFVATLCLMVRPCDRATPFIASSSDMHDGLVMLSRRNLFGFDLWLAPRGMPFRALASAASP